MEGGRVNGESVGSYTTQVKLLVIMKRSCTSELVDLVGDCDKP